MKVFIVVTCLAMWMFIMALITAEDNIVNRQTIIMSNQFKMKQKIEELVQLLDNPYYREDNKRLTLLLSSYAGSPNAYGITTWHKGMEK